MAMSEQIPLEFEREKWLDEYELRKREIEIKEREQSRSRWSNPVVLAVLAAALAGLSNAAATWLNGVEQRNLEAERAEQAKTMEETKAEAARIFEVIKTGDADKSAANLKFLVDTGLISNADRIKKIQTFLAQRPAGGGPALPVVAGQSPVDVQLLQMMMMMMMSQDDAKRKGSEAKPPPPPPPPKPK
jgi:hypothetical protein